MIGPESPLHTDRAARLLAALPNPVPLLPAPQAAAPPVHRRGAPPPKVPSCQAAEAPRGVPLNQVNPHPGPPHYEPRCSRCPDHSLPKIRRTVGPGRAPSDPTGPHRADPYLLRLSVPVVGNRHRDFDSRCTQRQTHQSYFRSP